MLRKLILLLVLMITVPTQAAAQKDAAGATLDARMQAFFREIPREPNDALAAFFPRSGDWTWVQTIHHERGGAPRIGVWRFPAAETPRVISADGPACPSFDHIRGEFGPFEGKFGMQMMMHPGPWRRVRGNRFVPPGASDRSTVFVEWRREGDEWVVSAFGDEDYRGARLLGVEANTVSRDTLPAPEGAAYAEGRPWYVDRQTILRDTRIYLQYGPPRVLDRAELRRVGVLDRVSVYAERGETAEEVLYIPISPGQYQPYQTFGPDPCR